MNRKEFGSMLILTRRLGESVMIGEDVTITILAVKGNQVRVGINAPKNLGVHREEIYRRIKDADCADISDPITGNFLSSTLQR